MAPKQNFDDSDSDDDLLPDESAIAQRLRQATPQQRSLVNTPTPEPTKVAKQQTGPFGAQAFGSAPSGLLQQRRAMAAMRTSPTPQRTPTTTPPPQPQPAAAAAEAPVATTAPPAKVVPAPIPTTTVSVATAPPKTAPIDAPPSPRAAQHRSQSQQPRVSEAPKLRAELAQVRQRLAVAKKRADDTKEARTKNEQEAKEQLKQLELRHNAVRNNHHRQMDTLAVQLASVDRDAKERIEAAQAAVERKVREELDGEYAALQDASQGLQDAQQQLMAQLRKIRDPPSAEDIRKELDSDSTPSGDVKRALHTFVKNLKTRLQDLPSTEDKALHCAVAEELRRVFSVSTLLDEQADDAKERQKALAEDLEFRAAIEDEHREELLKQDGLFSLDREAVVVEAHQHMLQQIRRDELERERKEMEVKEAWLVQLRREVAEEVRGLTDRCQMEFNAQLAAHQVLARKKSDDLAQRHKRELELMETYHARAVQAAHEEHQRRLLVAEQVRKEFALVQEACDRSVTGIKGVVGDVARVADRCTGYFEFVDERRVQFHQERLGALQKKQVDLDDLYGGFVSHCAHLEDQRRSLSDTTVKIDVLSQSLHKQVEEGRSWAASVLGKLERQKADWEREQRRWQHTLARERQSIEEEYGALLSQLRRAARELEDERKELETESDAVGQRGVEQARLLSQEINAAAQKEEEIRTRYDAMVTVVGGLETKGREVALEWDRLRQQRAHLEAQKKDIAKEEERMQYVQEHLGNMKQVVVQTHEDAENRLEHAKDLNSQAVSLNGRLHSDGEVLAERQAAIARDRQVLEQRRAAHQPSVRFSVEPTAETVASELQHRRAARQQGNLAGKLIQDLRQALGRPAAASAAPHAAGHRLDESAASHHGGSRVAFTPSTTFTQLVGGDFDTTMHSTIGSQPLRHNFSALSIGSSAFDTTGQY